MNGRRYEVWRRREAGTAWRSEFNGDWEQCQRYVRQTVRGYLPDKPRRNEFVIRKLGVHPVAEDIPDVVVP